MFASVQLLTLFCGGVFGAILLQEDGPLILTPFIENGETEKAKALSAVDPTLFAGVNSHAAYFTVNKTGKWNLFFWYFPVENVPIENTPLIIWLQGGPGASSLFGLFEEIGPIQIHGKSAQKMPITWGSDYSLLFIDNPVGTGFSFSDSKEYATNEDMGLAIGDGWTDPPTLQHYSEWALQVGLVDPEQAQEIHIAEEKARNYWNQHNFDSYAQNAKEAFSLLLKYAPVNMYNYLLHTTALRPPYEMFLNIPEVQSALHVKKIEYQSLSIPVYTALSSDMYNTVKPWLEELLEHYGVMCYNGQLDMIVAYALSVHTYRSFKWSGAEAYLKAKRIPVYDEKDHSYVNSFVKASGNFMDVMVRGAGHMVPSDKPREAKQIIDMFINKFK